MRGDYEAEDRKVGEHIAEHRRYLGVSHAQLIEAMGVGTDQIIRFVEKAQHPAIGQIERHHQAVIGAWARGAGHMPVPLARREQWYTTGRDVIMWHLAMARLPQVAWWWGTKAEPGARGAWCHYCNTLIHSYDVGRGMTRPARKAVMAHRLTHLEDTAVLAAATGGYAQ